MKQLENLLNLYQEIQTQEDADIEEMSSSPVVCAKRWVMESYTDGVPEEMPTHVETHQTGQHPKLPGASVEISVSEWEASRIEELLDRLRTPRPDRPEVMRKILMLGVQSLEYSSAHFLPRPTPSLLDES